MRQSIIHPPHLACVWVVAVLLRTALQCPEFLCIRLTTAADPLEEALPRDELLLRLRPHVLSVSTGG